MEVNGLLEDMYGSVRRDRSWESAMNMMSNQTAETSSELFFSDNNYDALLFDPIQISQNDHQTPISTFNNIESYVYKDSCLSFPSINNTQLYPLACMEEEELGILGDEIHILETQLESSNNIFNIGGTSVEKKASKKVQGQPSKNLMAERRRRKRLNDRLSMLRSIVPKISKMDRTSILGDTIDYVKELLERIENLRQEIDETSTAEINLFKDVKPNEVLVRNSPKFEVDRKNVGTKIKICCAGKPGLLYTTVTTLEALGIEIQQCVISCFNDFAMQAYCSEDLVKKTAIGPEEVKQALFRNAGYEGTCL